MTARVFHEAPVIGSVVQYIDGSGVTRAAIVTAVWPPTYGHAASVDLAYFPTSSTTLGVARHVGHESGDQDGAVWRWPR